MFVAEVVEIITSGLLRNSESCLHSYVAPDAGALPRGFYLVLRPTHAAEVCYDESARYHGPFAQRDTAERLKRSALYLSPLVPGRGSHARRLVEVVERASSLASIDSLRPVMSADASS